MAKQAAKILVKMKEDLARAHNEYTGVCARLKAAEVPKEWMPRFTEFWEHPDAANKYLKYCELLLTPAGGQLIILLGGDKVGSFRNFLLVREEISEKLKMLS
jgi:hypothetical protein